MFNPALATCASERMKTQRFSYFAGFAARELMREAKPVKLKKVAFSHFFDTRKAPGFPGAFSLSKNPRVDKGPQPLMFNPALTTCASERMKTQRFSFFAFGADRAIGASTG